MNKEYKKDEYRTIFGVEKNTYNEMVKIVENKYNNIHKKGAEKMEQLLRKELK